MKSAKEKFDEILKTDEFGLLDVTLPKSTTHKLNTLERDFAQEKFLRKTALF